ncbi:MAG TPA: class I SAM-dependent methyltransferase [Terriglobia bacterium]|nr:class I SAM-dependent methyltransferase [Terriglobia bacterium]
MTETSTSQTYKLLARYYDDFFTFHLEWYRQARRRLLSEILPQVRAACDLACGTGTTALELAQPGIKVFGVDLSPTMCRLARSKVRRASREGRDGADVTIIPGDMRTFRLPERVDLITCEFDALNHVPRKSDLARVAGAVARALRPGGTFYFDVNNRLAFQTIWPGNAWFEKPGVVMVMRGAYDERRDKGRTDAEWFIREKGGWRRFHERVEEVAWARAEVLQTLRATGFHRIRAYDANAFFHGNPRFHPGCRTFYVAQRQVA